MKQKMIYSLMVAFMMSMTVSVFAQQKDIKREKSPYTPEQRMEIQTKQISRTLMLDEVTSKKFVPVYENYLKDLYGVATACPLKMDREKGCELTDEEILKMIEGRFEMSQKILDLRKKYFAEFKKILTPRQIMTVYRTERHDMDKVRNLCGHRRDANHHYVRKNNIRNCPVTE